MLLRRGEGDVRAITAEEAGIVVVAFFTFEFGGDADDSDDDVGFAGGGNGVLKKMGREPNEASGGLPSEMEAFEFDGISVGGLEVNQVSDGAFAVRSPIIDEELAVEVEAAAATAESAEAVVAVDGRNECAGPADGVIFGGKARSGRGEVPVEIDVGVDAFESRGAGKSGVGEVFGVEAGRPGRRGLR